MLELNLFDFKDKLSKCIRVVDSNAKKIPDFFIDYLIYAEDHRSPYHRGIDHIGILRAIYKKLANDENQGASTIEQQFVRVVTGDYSLSVKRKIKEQALSVLLCRKRNKKDIAKAYLAIAYYGYGLQGIDGIIKLIGSELDSASENQIISLVAHLKYPKPRRDFGKWEKNFRNRVSYIQKKHEKATNKSRQKLLKHGSLVR